jgi:putative redox protein
VKITLLSEESIRLEGTPGPLTIEAESAEQQYSPFHMLASSLAVCTHSVLCSWADHVGFGADDLVIEVSWSFAENPQRVGTINLRYIWPSLPENRKAAAKRAAALCTIHATLTHPPAISVEEGA